MPGTGFVDHIGIGVPDLSAAKRYYDELMPILGLRAWFPTTQAGGVQLRPRWRSRFPDLLLPGTRARASLTPWHRPAAPVLHGVQPRHRPRGTRLGG
jgi:catechol 2,3-dioxygenase-like lactoylglutathione lyase family enzyme